MFLWKELRYPGDGCSVRNNRSVGVKTIVNETDKWGVEFDIVSRMEGRGWE